MCRSAAKCDTHCELLNIDTSPRVIASQIPSARVINTKINYRNRKVVAEQVLQSTECLGRKDRKVVDTTIDSTSNTFDRHEEFVASDSISWRQGKFSWLEMVLLDCSASNQQSTL